ncbi:hypothetical protein NIES4071_73340 [Calothrix sp. NIES-4071]|nr:hypothetical protein NIES4071_73340 [Calothrix sp. NIES-4071]BAZ61609.1 hypothetical protein NIES4105_73290 [Calothrix sp. NIES-4105]
MNTFSYVVGATTELQQYLILWAIKINEYLNLYYQGDIENAKGTIFFICIAKVNTLQEALNDPDNYDKFRAVKDNQGLIQAICLCEIAQLEVDYQTCRGLAIDTLTNAPWNTITYTQPETKKGAATSLIEELVCESQRLELDGILKALVIPSARDFYEDKGFVETDGSGEMILTSNAAAMFILDQEQRKLSQPFD